MSTDIRVYIQKVADALRLKDWCFEYVLQREGAGLPWLRNSTVQMLAARDKNRGDAVVAFEQDHARLYLSAEAYGKDGMLMRGTPPPPLHLPVVVSLATAARKFRQTAAVAREIDRELRGLEEVEALSGVEALR